MMNLKISLFMILKMKWSTEYSCVNAKKDDAMKDKNRVEILS